MIARAQPPTEDVTLVQLSPPLAASFVDPEDAHRVSPVRLLAVRHNGTTLETSYLAVYEEGIAVAQWIGAEHVALQAVEAVRIGDVRRRLEAAQRQQCARAERELLR